MALTPSLQGLLLADAIIRDEASGKVTIRDLFDCIEVEHPAAEFTAPASLFFQIRDVRGTVDLLLLYVDLSTAEVLLERSLQIESDDPLAVTGIEIPLQRIPAPHSGIHAWELHCNNEMIGSCRIQADVTNQPDSGV